MTISGWLIAKPKGKRYPFVNMYWDEKRGRWVDRYEATVYHVGKQHQPSEPLPEWQHWDLIYV